MHSFYRDYSMRDELDLFPLPPWALGLQVFPQSNELQDRSLVEQMEFAVSCMPLGAIGYGYRPDSPLHQLIQGFGLERLKGIAQLGYLTIPVDIDQVSFSHAMRFRHTRFVHSLDAAVLSAQIARKVHISQDEKLHLFVASLIHDILTPAGGDTTKLLDPKAFDEDKHFLKFFACKEAQQLCKQFKLDPVQLNSIVQEHGAIGQMKNLADKLAYVCRDAIMLLRAGVILPDEQQARAIQCIGDVIAQTPLIGNLWNDVTIIDDQLVFTNADRLCAFLRLRATMFRDLYLNPRSRSFEFLIHSAAMLPLFGRGVLNRNNLLEMVDEELDVLLREYMQACRTEILFAWSQRVQHHVCATIDQALTMKEELLNKTPFVMVEDFTDSVKPCTHWFVQNGDSVETVQSLCPEQASKIEKISSQANRVMVHWLENPHKDLLRAYHRLNRPKPA